MRDELLGYYERELTFLRQLGAEFAQKYPKIAARLLIDAEKCEDPHVERMIEAFAFLAGRIHLKIDDEYPEITESLLNIIYPHYLAPIPSMSVVQFALDPEQGKITTGYYVERGTTLFSKPIQGTPCRFRTSYPVTIWPVEVTEATLGSEDPVDSRGKWETARIKLNLRCLNETRFSELKSGEDAEKAEPLSSLRFYLNGEPHLTFALYELIFNNCEAVVLKSPGGRSPSGKLEPPVSISLPPSNLREVGFGRDEGMLPYTARSFMGYRLLTEFFTFPEKFLFFDLVGLEQITRRGGIGNKLEVHFELRDVTPPRGIVGATTFQLGCSPIINLFRKIAEPIQLSHEQNEYRVIPDVHRQMATEIYSIDSVTSTDPYLKQSREYKPFYSIRHADGKDKDRAFWYATRRASLREDDPGTEVYITLVNLGFDPHVPASDTLTIRTTSTNRDLPARLPFGGREGDFEVEGAAQISRVRCLKKPTATVRPQLRRGAQWRLISHLSLNHLSIVDTENGEAVNSLREILSLYDFMDSSVTRRHILGVDDVSSRRIVRQTGSRIGTGFVRGIETTVVFDEEQFVGAGVYLFAAVLERFLGLYVTANSFNQLVARTRQREGILKQWPPRAGDLALL